MALLSLAFVAVSRGAESTSSVKLRFGGDQSETRVVLEIPAAVRAEPASAEGRSLALSFSQLSVGESLEGDGRGLVKAWSLAREGGRAKLVLDLNHEAHIKRRFLLPPSDGVDAYRYVVDLESDGAPATSAVAAPVAGPVATVRTGLPAKTRSDPVAALLQASAPAAEPPSAKDDEPAPIKAAPTSRSGRKVVVIDAGHGGHDPGALGGDLREKDLTLAAAKALKTRLERTGRFKVVMTRDSDVFVPLEKRVQIARGANADLFISLHADAGGDPAVHGATVYTLSDKGEDRATRLIQGASFLDVKLPGRDKSVKQILLDLTQRNTRNRSGAFAETLIDNVGRQTTMVSRSHRDAGYMVLLAPDVPAVLLEMGFITNADDQSDLNDPGHRRHLMNAVGNAIEAYFADGLHIATH